MKCSNCGTKLNEDVKFCPVCGNKFVGSDVQNKPNEIIHEGPEEGSKENVNEGPIEELKEEPEIKEEELKRSPKTAGTTLKQEKVKKDDKTERRKQGSSKKKAPSYLKWVIGGIVLLAVGIFGYFYLNPAADDVESSDESIEASLETTEEEQSQAMDDAISAILMEDFEQAEVDLKMALDEDPENEEISNLYNQIISYNEGVTLFEMEDFSQGLARLNKSLEFSADSEYSDKVTEKANDLISQIEEIETNLATYQSDYEAAENHLSAEQFNDALYILQPYVEGDLLEESYYEELKSDMNELYERVETDQANAALYREEEQNIEASAQEDLAINSVRYFIEQLPDAVNQGNFSFQETVVSMGHSFYTEQMNFVNNTHEAGIREELNQYTILSAEADGEKAVVRTFESFEVINTSENTQSTAEYEATYYLEKQFEKYYITSMEIN